MKQTVIFTAIMSLYTAKFCNVKDC